MMYNFVLPDSSWYAGFVPDLLTPQFSVLMLNQEVGKWGETELDSILACCTDFMAHPDPSVSLICIGMYKLDLQLE